MQYFKPEGEFFVGDCMPFFHEGVFHLFYLVDENHHQGKNGLGGHQGMTLLMSVLMGGAV